jgi:hypothetical protein
VRTGKKPLPINCVGRNAAWVYPRLTPPKFADASTIVVTSRSHEMPGVVALPEGADVSVEFYGGAYSFRLDGERRRVYVRRFDYVSFTSEEEARYAFLTLWREVERLESAAEVERAAARWLDGWGRRSSEV